MQRREAFNVFFRAEEIGLHSQADVVVLPARGLEDVQRRVDVGGAFHVHFDVAMQCARRRGDFPGEAEAEVAVDVQAELRELDGNVAVDAVALQPLQHLDITGAHAASLLRGVDIFPQIVEAHPARFPAERGARRQRFAETFPGHKAPGKPVAHSTLCDGRGYGLLGR